MRACHGMIGETIVKTAAPANVQRGDDAASRCYRQRGRRGRPRSPFSSLVYRKLSALTIASDATLNALSGASALLAPGGKSIANFGLINGENGTTLTVSGTVINSGTIEVSAASSATASRAMLEHAVKIRVFSLPDVRKIPAPRPAAIGVSSSSFENDSEANHNEANFDPTARILRFRFSGPLHPQCVYDFDVTTGVLRLRKQDPASHWFAYRSGTAGKSSRSRARLVHAGVRAGMKPPRAVAVSRCDDADAGDRSLGGSPPDPVLQHGVHHVQALRSVCKCRLSRIRRSGARGVLG